MILSSSSAAGAPPGSGGSFFHSYAKYHLPFFASYLLFGLLHELSHVAIAYILLGPSLKHHPFHTIDDLLQFAKRALLGRYCLIEVVANDDATLSYWSHDAIRHFGWAFSLVMAMGLHYWQRRRRKSSSIDTSCGHKRSSLSSSWFVSNPIVVIAAYVTALEAVTTDLFNFVPIFGQQPMQNGSPSTALFLFCGNFGILLINSSWINVDGGKAALDMLEKMVEVTMMRGAQSGGVVTFEPAKSGLTTDANTQAPIIRGVRSRVVNAKRTVLSKGVRAKIEKDNCSMFGNNLSGWNDAAFNPNSTGKRLVRGFFGHTRFATSSKASMDGTHPHQWSPRRFYTFYPFQSAAAAAKVDPDQSGASRRSVGTGLADAVAPAEEKEAMHLSPKSQSIGVENFVTHNGDFEFYKIQGKYYDTEAIQTFLVKTLKVPMPATVDSAAIAGMMDLLRVQGCFALSARYALCFTVDSVDPMDPSVQYPSVFQYDEIGKVFEKALDEMVGAKNIKSLEEISSSAQLRDDLVSKVKSAFSELASSKSSGMKGAIDALGKIIPMDDIEEVSLGKFVQGTVTAFFDNDLLHTMRMFLENAKGSFGLCVTTSMDAHRQAVMAAKGQTLSVAFYPRKGVICYGSEQAAVKAGLNYETPNGKSMFGSDFKSVDENAVRLDLDDLGGEIVLLDWGYAGDNEPAISPPNRGLRVDKLMGGAVNVILLHQENVMSKSSAIHKRLVQLENNEFIKPLLNDTDDPVLLDIQDIPKICSNIQEDWKDVGLNRMTAWHLGQCIRHRMQAHVDGTIENHASQVDILVTGCEVSLWAAEQFAADLSKSFPKLYVKSVSANKLLGLFGQELSMPSVGFPYTEKTLDMKDPIVILVSHSGGTFGSLACSNLMQSFSSSIFCVSSEWDTQIGKQLRSMYGDKNDLLTSRIFSTEVGVRPAEPCSVSVVATHQLLTNIFEHICLTIIGNPHWRAVTGAVITERDLQTLERCNRDNIKSLERIIGVDRTGREVHDSGKATERELRRAGDLWAEHILENAKAYIMSFIYIVVTVTIGYPLISGIAYAAGLRADTSPGDRLFYFLRFLDALIYFWIPQINIFILRLFQGRNLRHRMVGRTVVIGDPCPWVAQSAEAFLGKLFACSYSIAGCNVLSGNPADHLVHRHTHRVVRGSLFLCGRPDGRLTALTTLEASTCLAVNQASSIQSIGGTCESITIGHNRSELPLSHKGIFLESHRPQFLCEKLLDENDEEGAAEKKKTKEMNLTPTGNLVSSKTSYTSFRPNGSSNELDTVHEEPKKKFGLSFRRSKSTASDDDLKHRRSLISFRRSTTGPSDDDLDTTKHRSSGSLLGAYSNLEKAAKSKANQQGLHGVHRLDTVIADMIKERKGTDRYAEIFHTIDADGNGSLDMEEFADAYKKINPDVSLIQLEAMFNEADLDGNGTLDLEEFIELCKMPQVDVLGKLSVSNRDDRGLVQCMPSTEKYFGEELRKTAPEGTGAFLMSQSQHLAMELYESRVASVQRFVAMTVMFHQMGTRVQQFFPKISFGCWGYRMDRTHSIMRIATTASPVSGADVRDRMVELHLRFKIQKAVNLVSRRFLVWKEEKESNKSE